METGHISSMSLTEYINIWLENPEVNNENQ